MYSKSLMITGGPGFIGSHVVRLFLNHYSDYRIINLDTLTYAGNLENLITYVKHRPGHDRRYAIDATKINKKLSWSPSVTFEEGLAITKDWYLSNANWTKFLKSRV